MSEDLLLEVRRRTGLTQAEFAARAGTSRTTLSAYERGNKSPNLDTFERLLGSAGFELSAVERVDFHEVALGHGHPAFVANHLWRLPLKQIFADVTLPLSLNWTRPGTEFHLSDRRQRARCYEIVLREGTPADMMRYIDGAMLVDLWPDLVLPADLRAAWNPVIDGE